VSDLENFAMKIGAVHLYVSHLERAVYFYEEALGFKTISTFERGVVLGSLGDHPLLVLHSVNNPPPRKKTTGLYHLAVRLPAREDLARLIYHLVNNQVEISGVADHGVSEAVYLTGPDDVGIELTCDRELDEWPMDEEGQVEMGTDDLDLDDLMMQMQGKSKKWIGLPAGTVIGHVHLKVAELDGTLQFYERLGFQLNQEYDEEALFFASGSYHHHIGANIWESAGADPLPSDTAGLNYFEILVSETNKLDSIKNTLVEADIPIEIHDDGLLISDPNGIRMMIKTG
jgi:catechol 2,3-dioxygenase